MTKSCPTWSRGTPGTCGTTVKGREGQTTEKPSQLAESFLIVYYFFSPHASTTKVFFPRLRPKAMPICKIGKPNYR